MTQSKGEKQSRETNSKMAWGLKEKYNLNDRREKDFPQRNRNYKRNQMQILEKEPSTQNSTSNKNIFQKEKLE